MNSLDRDYYKKNIKEHIEQDFDEEDEDYGHIDKDDYKEISEIEDD